MQSDSNEFLLIVAHLFYIICVQKAGGTQEITKAFWTETELQEMNFRWSAGYYTGIRTLQLT